VGTFNVGGGQANSSSLLELFETLQTLTGNLPIFTKGPTRNFDQKVFISDNSLISSRIGWKPTVNYHDGLQALINWLGFSKV
jgi:CDP-paratose 2-epimerase